MKRIKKQDKEKIMALVQKANSEEYETSWDEKGVPVFKKKSEIKRGKKSRAAGARFELKVRNDLEKKGWVVDKWTNNVDLIEEKLVKAKRKYNPFKKMLIVGTGFPDFIGFRLIEKNYQAYEVLGVEVKTKGYLDKEEKEKCSWLVGKKFFLKF